MAKTVLEDAVVWRALEVVASIMVDCMVLYGYGVETDCKLEVVLADGSYSYGAADSAEDVVKLSVARTTSADMAEVVSDSYSYGVGIDDVPRILKVVDSN